MKKRLAIFSTHPIQYHAPWYRALQDCTELETHVYFGHRASSGEQAAAGFGVEFDWDDPILEGYPHTFLANVASAPSVLTFSGLDVPGIREVVRRGGFDAVMVNGWHYKAAWQAIFACWRSGKPVMVRSDSHLHTSRSPFKRLLKWPAYRAFIPRLDVCLPVGTWSREYFLHYGAPRGRICVLPHVVDFPLFRRRCQELLPRRRDLRESWGLPPGSAVFLFAGKFIPKKRPLDFVRAVAAAVDSGAPVAGLMAGDGELKLECEAFAARSGAPIRFAGFLNLSRIVEAYVAADALVLPSDEETWGLVANEAMSCGRPCLVSDRVGCGPDLIDSGRTGAVFPMGDIGALTCLMVEFARPGRLEAMREAALEMAGRYTAEAAAQATLLALQVAASKIPRKAQL